ncbi:MAG: 4Fe-4S binding protein [Ignisphaera sp.]
MRRPRLLELTLKNLFRKPATIEYPRKKTPVESDYRGLQYADLTKCTGCSICALECPANAIAMTPIPQGYEAPKTNPRRLYPLINYGKCVFCYRCVTVCPFNAYITTPKYDLANAEKTINSSPLSLSTLRKG